MANPTKNDRHKRVALVVAGMALCLAVALLATARPAGTALAPVKAKTSFAQVHLEDMRGHLARYQGRWAGLTGTEHDADGMFWFAGAEDAPDS